MASSDYKESNPLHLATTFNTIFTLSGLTEQEIRDKSFLTNAPHDIIARSGGIGESANITENPVSLRQFDPGIVNRSRDFSNRYDDSVKILSRSHDMFIENVNILSTVGPNNERNLANFTKMEFEVHEPYGITLIEKVRAATALNGFLDYQDAPLLLTIEFKGFSENGEPMHFGSRSVNVSSGNQDVNDLNQGELTGRTNIPGLTRRIPILIARVDFDVNEGGAKYNVVAVPYTDMGFDDRFKFPRTDIPIASDDAVAWTLKVQEHLDRQMQQEIDEKKREHKDEYRFIIDREVITNGKVYESQADSIHTTSQVLDLGTSEFGYFNTGDAKQFTKFAKANSFTALTKFFEDAVRQSFGYISLVQNFWEGYLGSLKDDGTPAYSGISAKNPESITKVLQSKEFANRIASDPFIPWFKIKSTVQTDTSRFDNITKMHPKIIIYRAIPYRIHVLKLMGAGMSVKADWSQYVRKEYNYIYTGENVDVQGLRINYKSAYYMRNVREAKSTTETGVWGEITQTIIEAFGQERDPEPTLPLRQYPSILKGRSTAETTNPENVKAQEFYDYLTNPEADMMRIELDILGDPAYLCQDIYVPTNTDANEEPIGGQGKVFDTSTHSFNADQFMPCINLVYRLPDDIDEKEGTMFSGKEKFRDERLFFSGVYQVVKVDSRFDQGQFMQTLTCVRLNNQSGAGVPIDLVNSARKGTSKLINDAINDAKDKANENIQGAVDDFFRDAAG